MPSAAACSEKRARLALLAAWLSVVSAVSPAVHADVRFHYLGIQDGLSTGAVYSVMQDRQGYIWLATGNGLDRYDGFKFEVFKHNPGDADSLSSDFVKALYEDRAGRLWVGTYGGGLDLYDNDRGKFIHYRHVDGDPHGLASNKIWSLGGGPEGTILVGTFDAGIDVLDPASGTIRHFAVDSPSGLSNNRINHIYTDRRGITWLATHHGLDEFDLAHGIIHPYFDGRQQDEINTIWKIAEDHAGRLWLATARGPDRFDPATGTFDPGVKGTASFDKLSQAYLHSITVDSGGNVWVGSAAAGLYLVKNGSTEVTGFGEQTGNAESLASNNVWDTYEDSSGLIWIATNNGIDIADPRMLELAYLKPLDIDPGSRSASNLADTALEHDGALLIGSSAGIYRMELKKRENANPLTVFARIDNAKYGTVTSLYDAGSGGLIAGTSRNYLLKIGRAGALEASFTVGRGMNLPDKPINGIIRTDDGKYFLATFGNGLLVFDMATDETRRVVSDTTGGLLPNDTVEVISQVAPHKMLAGTFRGLYEVDEASLSAVLIPLSGDRQEPVIQSLSSSEAGSIWVGTYEGLWKLILDRGGRVKGKQYFSKPSKGYNAAILAIEPDARGNLWLSGDTSITRFDPRNGETFVLGRDQGLPPMEYYSYSHTHTSDGRLWFGGPEGIIGFAPTEMRANLHDPKVTVNGITVYKNDKPSGVTLGADHTLVLSYQDSIVTFDLAAMDFAAPQANTYSYRLVGFQPQWTVPTNTHQVTFTNLSPGRYRLEARAANNWGTWSGSPASVDIIVLPPWWRTWWAYTLYILLIIGSSIAYIYSLKRKIKREEAISASLREANEIKSNFVEKLEVQVKEATQELRETLQGVNLKNAELEVAQKRATEGEQIKSQFLANMSHELRTPLTGVLGYTKLLTSTPLSSEQKDYVGTIRQSSETLLAIINDTLDLSRLEAGKLLIDEVDFDLLEVIESTLELLAPTAYQKRLELVRVVPPEIPLQLRGDPLRLRQVLTNLLSNAIKFTESGSVSIEVRAAAQEERDVVLVFTVSDTGIGIPEGEVGQLFTAYARGRISTRHHVEGTGLGLAICKKLLDLMGGEIRVASRVGSGTRFDFQLRFKLQKNVGVRPQLPSRLRVLLYDAHPLSNQAWHACLARMGAEVRVAADLEAAATLQADAAVMSLSERDLSQLQELRRKLPPAMPPTLVLAPRIERQALRHLSETLYHRVLSKSAREKTVYLELQSLVQTALKQESDVVGTPPRGSTSPSPDAPLVLVADDNRINRRLLVTMLNQSGFRTAEAGTGLELLDLAARGPWHAALLDIHMPGLDGIETAVRLRSTYGDGVPPIIAMSADVMPEVRGQTEQGIMDDFLMKPFNEQQLVELLRQHIDRHDRRRRGTG